MYIHNITIFLEKENKAQRGWATCLKSPSQEETDLNCDLGCLIPKSMPDSIHQPRDPRTCLCHPSLRRKFQVRRYHFLEPGTLWPEGCCSHLRRACFSTKCFPSDCLGTSGCGKDKLWDSCSKQKQLRSNLGQIWEQLSQLTLLYFRSLSDCLNWTSHSWWWKLFRLAAQHIHWGPPSPLVTILVH